MMQQKSPTVLDLEKELAKAVSEMTVEYGELQTNPEANAACETIWGFISDFNYHRRNLRQMHVGSPFYEKRLRDLIDTFKGNF